MKVRYIVFPLQVPPELQELIGSIAVSNRGDVFIRYRNEIVWTGLNVDGRDALAHGIDVITKSLDIKTRLVR